MTMDIDTHKFKRSDVVRLRSGGPLMVIEEFSSGVKDTAYCRWFNMNAEGAWEATAYGSYFNENCLVLEFSAKEEEDDAA